MSKPWFRLYVELLNDPKVQRLDGNEFKAWINVLCVASQDEFGKLPPVDDLAFILRIDETVMERFIERFIKQKLLDRDKQGHIIPHNWTRRQYQSDTSTERVKAHREKKKSAEKGVDETVMKRFTKQVSAVTVTPSDSDTDSDTDSEAAARVEADAGDTEINPFDTSIRTPTRHEFCDFAAARGIAAVDALEVWGRYERKTWRDVRGRPIRNWTLLLTQVARGGSVSELRVTNTWGFLTRDDVLARMQSGEPDLMRQCATYRLSDGTIRFRLEKHPCPPSIPSEVAERIQAPGGKSTPCPA